MAARVWRSKKAPGRAAMPLRPFADPPVRLPAAAPNSGGGQFLCLSHTLDHIAEVYPGLAIKPLHLERLDRPVFGRPGVHLYPGQQGGDREVVQTFRLMHDVLAGKVAVTLPQDLHQDGARAIGKT